MKKLLVGIVGCLALSVASVACGKQAQNAADKAKAFADYETADAGLAIKFKNDLPEIDQDGRKVRPTLTAYVCTPLPQGVNPSPPNVDRCKKLEKTIEGGDTGYLVFTKAETDAFLQRSDKISFEFQDSEQNAVTRDASWPCATPHYEYAFSPDTAHPQHFEVSINARHNLTYGCVVEKK